MADAFVSFNVVNADKIAKRLKELPELAGDMGIEAANNYLLNILIRKEIPPQKHVSRITAYGKTFFTERQRRFFFWALAHGVIEVPYRRRRNGYGVSGSWRIVGKGRKALIENDDPAAEWVYSENQARLNQLVGWRRVSQILDKYTPKIVQAFERGVKAALKKMKL